jgi:hypothetical protein
MQLNFQELAITVPLRDCGTKSTFCKRIFYARAGYIDAFLPAYKLKLFPNNKNNVQHILR